MLPAFAPSRGRGSSRRSVVMAGRAMERVTAVARECGYLDGIPDFLTRTPFHTSPATTCPFGNRKPGGMPRRDRPHGRGHAPVVTLNPGDQVIFSSRTIPEMKGGRAHYQQSHPSGVEVVTDRTALVHASGIRAVARWHSSTAGSTRTLRSPRMARISSRRTCGFRQIACVRSHRGAQRRHVLLAPGTAGSRVR